MHKPQNITSQEENELKKVVDLISDKYRYFIISIVAALLLAFFINHYSIPVYKVSSSLLIENETGPTSQGTDMNDYLNSSLFGVNENFRNELWILKSSPVIEQVIRNLDLSINYYVKKRFQYMDLYKETPFQVLLLNNHVQPLNIRFKISIQDNEGFHIQAKAKKVTFQRINNEEAAYIKNNWTFDYYGRFGELIETDDLAFVIQIDTTRFTDYNYYEQYSFTITDVPTTTVIYKDALVFNEVQNEATVVEIRLKSKSLKKGEDFLNELMNVYSQQDLDRKNHIAAITIDYIEEQLNVISDSLSQTENNLQTFRSVNQLLDVSEQTTGISSQYRELQNQMAELVTRKRYYDDVSHNLTNDDDLSNMIVPAAIGIDDQLLNSLMSELISAQLQRSILIENGQGQNPMVQRLNIQIENARKTIAENIEAALKTTEISIDEMEKRIRQVEAQISRLPITQRQLGGIEREYRLNDAIYNYLLEKRAEAKITQASNLPDNRIIEPANMVGYGPVFPNNRINYLTALILGLIIPYSFFVIKSALNNKIVPSENLGKLTETPILGKIMHNTKKTENVMMQFPKSTVAESFRALRTNFNFYFRGSPNKVVLITSTLEGEGKSFNALNIALSFAQLDRKTVLINYDLRKSYHYFKKDEEAKTGLSSYYTNSTNLEKIIFHSPHEKLDYIPAGPIPPNPIELIALDKTKELLDDLKTKYEYIVLDTTPLAHVSDAYLLLDYADVKVLIARYNYTLKKVFSLITTDLKQKNINNVCLVMNDNRISDNQYGYGYGYKKKKDHAN